MLGFYPISAFPISSSLSGIPNTGPIQFTLNGNSSSIGSVSFYYDGTIFIAPNVFKPSIIRTSLTLACIYILKQTLGIAKQYKLSVYRKGKREFTLRSVLWGSLTNIIENEPNYQIIDRQFLDNSTSY